MGMLEDIVASVFSPGINAGVQKAMHLSFAALFVSLLALGALWEFNMHVIVLLSSALGLYVSILWTINELYKAKAEAKQEDSSTTDSTSPKSFDGQDSTSSPSPSPESAHRDEVRTTGSPSSGSGVTTRRRAASRKDN